jgi:hypothetical protein
VARGITEIGKAFAIIALAVQLGGCIVTPDLKDGSELNQLDIWGIDPGLTTREELLERFGIPYGVAVFGEELVIKQPARWMGGVIRPGVIQRKDPEAFFELFAEHHALSSDHRVYYYYHATSTETLVELVVYSSNTAYIEVDELWVLVNERTQIVEDYVYPPEAEQQPEIDRAAVAAEATAEAVSMFSESEGVLGVFESKIESGNGEDGLVRVELARSGEYIAGKRIPDDGTRISGRLVSPGRIAFHWVPGGGGAERVGYWEFTDSTPRQLQGRWDGFGVNAASMIMTQSSTAPRSNLAEFDFESAQQDQAAAVNLTGTYRSEINGTWRRSQTLFVMHSGDRFVASSEDETIELGGTVSGNVIEFQWYRPNNKGKGRFTIDFPEKLSGPYRGDSWGQGEWTLEKID